MKDIFRVLIDRIRSSIRKRIDKELGQDGSKKPDSGFHPISVISVWYGGVNMSSATIDTDYRLTVSPDGRNWSEAPASWRSGHAGPGSGHDSIGCCSMAYQRPDGSWVGGKYEWLTRPVRPRSYANINNGYSGWVAPPRGTKVFLWVHTADGNRVSTAVETTY
jgi:hypothetical protein